MHARTTHTHLSCCFVAVFSNIIPFWRSIFIYLPLSPPSLPPSFPSLLPFPLSLSPPTSHQRGNGRRCHLTNGAKKKRSSRAKNGPPKDSYHRPTSSWSCWTLSRRWELWLSACVSHPLEDALQQL